MTVRAPYEFSQPAANFVLVAGRRIAHDNLHVYVASATAASVTSFAPPAQRIARSARRRRRLHLQHTPGGLRHWHLAGRRGRNRDLAGGRFVYITGYSADSLLVFSRDAASGRLTQLAGTAGCIRPNRTDCAPVTGLDGPSAIAIAQDGTSLYVASSAGTLTSFARDVTTGALTQLPLGVGCLSDGELGGCTAVGGLARASLSRSRRTAAR